jgi:hypothetical protein
LARGLVALHEAGRIHRDLKPSNVLVTPEGRVVILDFGLAAEVECLGLYQSTEPHIVGTVAYMAPEQAAGQPVSAASDWYSVGVIVYQALTGELPFRGSPVDVLSAKQHSDPPLPSRLVPGIPEDLETLCVALLQTDSAGRPAGADILQLLGPGTDVPSFHALSQYFPDRTNLLIGRERHLEALAETYSLTKQGRTVVVHVSGPSGSGKSTLVRHFLDDLCRREEAVVLAGRCYERESVPYKAFDGVIDALSRYLRRLPSLEADAVLPRDMPLLSQIFPVLRLAEHLASALRHTVRIPDPQEVRRRTFSALRELLARLGDRKRVVLWIDDLQWGDVDSAVLLAEVLRPPEPPVLLLVGCYRTEDVAASPFLQHFLTSEHEHNAGLERRQLAVEELTVEETKALVQVLFNPIDQPPRSLMETIARESGGNPFFAAELVHYAHDRAAGQKSDGATLGMTLDEALWERIQRLPDPARRLLEAVAVAGHPILSVDACKAAALSEDERPILTLLRASRLVRSMGPSPWIEVEAYHDRVRETVLFHLAPTALTEHHRSLARTLEASDRAEPETLATHFHGAGEAEKAAEYYAVAASRAAKTLAFVRAATYYRLALEISPVRGERAALLRIGLGDALANAGRGAEAALAYIDASLGVNATEALQLRRRAALQFLISGHIDAGLDTLRTVLASVGMTLPNTPRQALLSLLPRRIHLRLRGLRFHARYASEVPVEELNKIDICWSAVAGLSMVEPIFGALFQARHLLLALRAGEPDRLARALAVEAVHVATGGRNQRRQAACLIDSAATLASRTGDLRILGLITMVRGAAAYFVGRWKEASDLCEQADEYLRTRCTGVSWEMDTAQAFRLFALHQMGEVSELRRMVPQLLAEAESRGDLYGLVHLGAVNGPMVELVEDDVDRAECQLQRVAGLFPIEKFNALQNDLLFSRIAIDLYKNDMLSASSNFAKLSQFLRHSLMYRIQIFRIFFRQLQCRMSLSLAASRQYKRDAHLRAAVFNAGRLEREKTPASAAIARQVLAEVAQVRGDTPRAVEQFKGAVTAFEAADMRLLAAVARRRLGELIGGDEGTALVAEANTWMTRQGIKNLTRMSAYISPIHQRAGT